VSTFTEPVATRIDWETPKWLFDHLEAEFHFTHDVCASYDNTKIMPSYWDEEDDALRQQWHGVLWMNPPYGKQIGEWVYKAYLSAVQLDATVVCLLPARSNCDWWKYVIQGEVRFIRRKLRFVGASSDSMFPNVIVIFRPKLEHGGTMSILDVREDRT
jgi:phage N-6-adenine-methyltransferase